MGGYKPFGSSAVIPSVRLARMVRATVRSMRCGEPATPTASALARSSTAGSSMTAAFPA